MIRRRKRTNANVPAKGRLKDMADQLWSLAVRDDWNHKCAVCGKGPCEAHHLIPRQHEATRYDLMNGVCLCSRHHQFDPDLSPHQNAAGWLMWLKGNSPTRYEWYVETMAAGVNGFTGTKNHVYYTDTIRNLRQYVSEEEFERVCGVRFTEYLRGMDSNG